MFFNNLTSSDGSVEHAGDNLTGEGEGDDETIKVNLAAVPAGVHKIVFPVSIYEAGRRKQSFGQVRNAFIRVLNARDNAEIARSATSGPGPALPTYGPGLSRRQTLTAHPPGPDGGPP